ncbi:MAG TPA: hypothetical protein VGC06_09925 [Actinomycetes bacterium]
MSSNRFDPLDENEREWLSSSRRVRRRRAWASLLAVAVIIALVVWLVIAFLPRNGGRSITTPVQTSAQDKLIADSRQALADWGRFGVSGDLNQVKRSFWPDGPQYKQLVRESPQLKQHPIGPPAYQFTLEDPVTVLQAGKDRLVRGVVKSTRQGTPSRSFRWDIYMRQDLSAGGRWRVWTVANSPQR